MVEEQQFGFGKTERLKRRKLIDRLFSEGRNCSVPGYRVQYLLLNESEAGFVKAGVSVSKRNFKKATDRNRIKRLLREAYRQGKTELRTAVVAQQQQLICFFIYQGKELPASNGVNESVQALLKKLQTIAHEKTRAHT